MNSPRCCSWDSIRARLPSAATAVRAISSRNVVYSFPSASNAGLSERAARDALGVVTSSYEYHGGFRLRTLSA